MTGKTLESLENLKKAIINSLIYISVFSLIFYFFSGIFFRILQKPIGIPLVYYNLADGFFTYIRVALYCGLFFSMPLIFFELWKIFAPFIFPNYKDYSVRFVVVASIFFFGGALICYFILLPSGINFLLAYQTEQIKPVISVTAYLSLVIIFLLGFGLIFELPLIMFILGRAGLVTGKFLNKNRRFAVLIIAILSAVITPTPDVYNMMLMMLPLWGLYEISVIVVYLFGKKPLE